MMVYKNAWKKNAKNVILKKVILKKMITRIAPTGVIDNDLDDSGDLDDTS